MKSFYPHEIDVSFESRRCDVIFQQVTFESKKDYPQKKEEKNQEVSFSSSSSFLLKKNLFIVFLHLQILSDFVYQNYVMLTVPFLA